MALSENIEDWKIRVEGALAEADGLLWWRIQRANWKTPLNAQVAVAAHKKIEQARDALDKIEKYPDQD